MNKTKINVYYLLSEEGQKNSLLAGGNGEDFQKIETEVTGDVLELLEDAEYYEGCYHIGFFDIDGDDEIGVATECYKYLERYDGYDTNEIVKRFDKVMTLDELLNWERDRLNSLEKSRKKIMDNYLDKASEFDKEKNEWIRQYGSINLKRLLKDEESIDLCYVLERMAKELPGFEVVYDVCMEETIVEHPDIQHVDSSILNELDNLIRKGYKASIKMIKQWDQRKIKPGSRIGHTVIFIDDYLNRLNRYNVFKRFDDRVQY